MRAEMTGGRESQSNICMFGFYKDKAMDSQSNYEIPACLGKTGRVSMELWPGIIISYTVITRQILRGERQRKYFGPR